MGLQDKDFRADRLWDCLYEWNQGNIQRTESKYTVIINVNIAEEFQI